METLNSKSGTMLLSISNPFTDIDNGYTTAVNLDVLPDHYSGISLKAVLKAPLLKEAQAAIRTMDYEKKRFFYLSKDQFICIHFGNKDAAHIKYDKVYSFYDKILSLDYDKQTDKIYAIINQTPHSFNIVEIDLDKWEFRVIKNINGPDLKIYPNNTVWLPSSNTLVFGITKNNQYFLASYKVSLNELNFTRTQEPFLEKWNYDTKTQSIYGISKANNNIDASFSYSLVNVNLKDGTTISKKHLPEISKSYVLDSTIDVHNRLFILSLQARNFVDSYDRWSIINFESGKEIFDLPVPALYKGNTSGLEVVPDLDF